MSDVRPSTGALRAPAQDEDSLSAAQTVVRRPNAPHPERREAAVEGRTLVMQLNLGRWLSFAHLALPAVLLVACDPGHSPVYNMTDCPIAATVRYSDGTVMPGLLRPKTRMSWTGPPIATDISDIKIEDSFGHHFDFPRDALFRLTNQTSIDAEFGFDGRDLQLMNSRDSRNYRAASDFMSLPAEYPSCRR